MKILIIDPSGKVPIYDNALCNALSAEIGEDIEFASPYNQIHEFKVNYKFRRLIHIPDKLRKTTLRKLKSIEGLINYIYISFLLLFKHYDIVHFQWLPFIEYIGIEKYFLQLFHIFSPNTYFILTQHNLYPHNSSNIKKEKYQKRMKSIKKYFTHFIVHTLSSKDDFCKEFGINNQIVSIVYHGIFKPDTIPARKAPKFPKRLLIFGYQSCYKGTDILVDAVGLLPEIIRNNIHLTIAGRTDVKLYNEKKNLADRLNIEWINHFVSDENLNQLIADADVLLLPYRSISQSGVLLLSLPFKKHLIVSNLASFKETLDGYPNECFVETGSAESLAKAITLYIEGKTNLDMEKEANEKLLSKYSWENSANKTIEIYRTLFNPNFISKK